MEPAFRLFRDPGKQSTSSCRIMQATPGETLNPESTSRRESGYVTPTGLKTFEDSARPSSLRCVWGLPKEHKERVEKGVNVDGLH